MLPSSYAPPPPPPLAANNQEIKRSLPPKPTRPLPSLIHDNNATKPSETSIIHEDRINIIDTPESVDDSLNKDMNQVFQPIESSKPIPPPKPMKPPAKPTRKPILNVSSNATSIVSTVISTDDNISNVIPIETLAQPTLNAYSPKASSFNPPETSSSVSISIEKLSLSISGSKKDTSNVLKSSELLSPISPVNSPITITEESNRIIKSGILWKRNRDNKEDMYMFTLTEDMLYYTEPSDGVMAAPNALIETKKRTMHLHSLIVK